MASHTPLGYSRDSSQRCLCTRLSLKGREVGWGGVGAWRPTGGRAGAGCRGPRRAGWSACDGSASRVGSRASGRAESRGARASGLRSGVRDVVEAGDRPGDRTAEAFLDHVPRDAELLAEPLGRDALAAVRGDAVPNQLVRAVAADAHDRGGLLDREEVRWLLGNGSSGHGLTYTCLWIRDFVTNPTSLNGFSRHVDWNFRCRLLIRLTTCHPEQRSLRPRHPYGIRVRSGIAR